MARKKSEGHATILQVAAQAELSIATVSRVLNGGKYVSETTRKKVLDAAKKLDYQPNYMARQLHGQDDFSIGVILGLDLGTISPFALKVYEILKVHLQQKGYRAKRAKFSIDGQLETKAKAFIAIGIHESDPRLKSIHAEGLPVIYIGEPKEDAFWVSSNDEQGGFIATRHLLDNGCRTIYFVCLNGEHQVSRLRHAGYRRAMIEAGLIPSEIIEIGNSTGLPALDSYRRIRPLMESGLRPDGFVAFSDIVATGICMALTDLDKQVPQDVHVVGYDGIDNDRYHALTSVNQDIEGIAGKAASLVFEAIRNEAPRGEFLDVFLRQGHTTGEPVLTAKAG
ncbi:LacI family DNA-binding transcriptional regulator [Endozoicomonas euniceicola]|uniref:LacI family transcriptional regulator n=1 Tax=Endozoicomonas euniceicola TaxID=1234143 RepID=A0ABY6GX07_9GAMM|nr:LacI family DNA-binding transcriptional regulator [Endozoicomonas euniceicola]UYM17317.1 LacI family transcriptional regulator [Endozoicomonas euniceicola]